MSAESGEVEIIAQIIADLIFVIVIVVNEVSSDPLVVAVADIIQILKLVVISIAASSFSVSMS